METHNTKCAHRSYKIAHRQWKSAFKSFRKNWYKTLPVLKYEFESVALQLKTLKCWEKSMEADGGGGDELFCEKLCCCQECALSYGSVRNRIELQRYSPTFPEVRVEICTF